LNPIFSSHTDYILENIWHSKDAKASKIKALMHFLKTFLLLKARISTIESLFREVVQRSHRPLIRGSAFSLQTGSLAAGATVHLEILE